jgi:hypothetical protein
MHTNKYLDAHVGTHDVRWIGGVPRIPLSVAEAEDAIQRCIIDPQQSCRTLRLDSNRG